MLLNATVRATIRHTLEVQADVDADRSRRSRYLRLERICVAVDSALLNEHDSGRVREIVSVYRDLVVLPSKSYRGIKRTVGRARRFEGKPRWHGSLVAPVDVQESGIACDVSCVIATPAVSVWGRPAPDHRRIRQPRFGRQLRWIDIE